jgi:hypothetical protein
MDMRLLVQTAEEVDAGKVAKFLQDCKDAKLMLIHSSLKDDTLTRSFFSDLIKKIKVPFVGTKVSASATNEGYFEDAVAVAVLCGDFEVKVFTEKLEYDDVEGTIKKIAPKLDDATLCLIHSSNYYQQNAHVDAILRRIQERQPKMQMWGITSKPQPIIATEAGIQENFIAFAAIKGLDHVFHIDSGFQFDEKRDTEYKITKADEYHIYEINGRDAVDEYSKIQHIRPYLLNTISTFSARPDAVQLFEVISQLNAVLYDGVIKIMIKPLGTDLNGKAAEILLALHLEEKGRRSILTHAYKPEGTILRHLSTTPENQLAVYDRIQEKSGKAMLGSACAMCLLWSNFDTKALEKKLKTIKYPLLVSYVFGEYGTNLPYKGQNLVHGSVVTALTLK